MDDGIAPLFLVTFWSSIGPLALVLLLIFISAMISGSEVALFSLTPSQKNQLRESPSSVDRRVIELLEDPDRELAPRKLLATILIVNNAVNIAIVLLASQLTETWFAGSHYPPWVMTVVDVFAITFVIVLFGEVVPKVYATTGNLQVARIMALPLKFLNRLCAPFTWLLLKSSAMIERGVKKKIRSNISVDELGHALELTADDGRSEDENRILEGIVTFGGKEAGQIMTPRTQVVLLDSSMSFAEVLKVVRDKGFSRLPVSREESPDKIEGFLFIKDLLGHLKEDDFHWQSLI
ncbi:MAG: CNNM domain-containing protein, partial [Flavobacteriales bacterium]